MHSACCSKGGAWAQAYSVDTDGDNYTNGEELGDPNGQGIVDAGFPVTDPNNPAAYPCGSNTIEGPEICDGALLGGETCENLGLEPGTLLCNGNCDGFDTTGCGGGLVPVCGDGIVDAGEQCDDGVANSDVLADACRTDCTYPYCGDGVVDTGEACDEGINNDDNGDCTTQCAYGGCGNGVVDAGEECDDGPDNSDVQPDACRTTCVYYYCGDGVVDAVEVCDDGQGNSPNGPCSLQCEEIGDCGNGQVDPGEECDQRCQQLGRSTQCVSHQLQVLLLWRRRTGYGRKL